MALVGGNHVINFPRFVPEEVLDAVTTYRPKYLYLVPTMMNRIWKLPDDVKAAADLSSLEVAVHMAAPCPAWLKEEWIHWAGPDVLCELYAGTEVQSVTWITGREWLEHHGSVGKPIAGKMKVVRDDGSDADPGEIGEIYMQADGGRNSTYQYLGADAKQLGNSDWESLGDMGWIDADGYVYLADRRKDLILRGGANIYPAEVEAAIDEHPAVRSCCVIGVPDDDLGQRVHAIVDAPDGVDEAALRAHLAERLVSYKCPSTYEFVDEPVRDDAGKVRRSLLVAERS
jgi:bile acid-coenzyme A ligase